MKSIYTSQDFETQESKEVLLIQGGCGNIQQGVETHRHPSGRFMKNIIFHWIFSTQKKRKNVY
jgi:hypothetical protein